MGICVATRQGAVRRVSVRVLHGSVPRLIAVNKSTPLKGAHADSAGRRMCCRALDDAHGTAATAKG